jgi:hypothetical protein
MLNYDLRSGNDDDPRQKLRVLSVNGHALSELALFEHLRRMSELVQSRSVLKMRPDIESCEIWICVDHHYPGMVRDSKKTLWPTFTIYCLLAYIPKIPTAPPHMNEVLILRESLASPRACPWYTDDRPTFAGRLLHLVGKCWIETAEFWKKIEQPKNPRPQWPVKMWIHGVPERVWEITADGQLMERPDHPPVDESIVEPRYPEPSAEIPPPPSEVDLDITSEGAEVRWRPVPDVDGYLIEWSSDGVDFSTIENVETAEAIVGPDGLCRWLDTMAPEDEDYYIRMMSYRGDAEAVSEPTTPIHAKWRL